MRTARPVTDRELDVISAWWHQGTVKGAADLLGLHVQTAKNLLHTARMRAGVPNTLALAQLTRKDHRSMAALKRRRKVAA